MCPSAEAAVTCVTARAYTIPTDAPESDGTIAWDSTTMVAAEVEAGGEIGLGYTYCDKASASVIEGVLAKALKDKDALATEACWSAMNAAVRNAGRPGIASCAVSAVDIALWDLKAKLFRVPLATLLGPRAPDRTCLRQWRLHLLRRRAPQGAARRLGCRRLRLRENEDRPRTGPRREAGRGRQERHRRRRIVR
jgi:L-alanine-DL-glutamate epimerase-like enolase superfamily enzyme